MNNFWSQEIWRFSGMVALATLLGLGFGILPWALLFVTLAYLVWHLRNVNILGQWLRGQRGGFPESSGVWDDIFFHIHRLQERNRKRKKRLTIMLKSFRESTDAMPDAAIVLDQDGIIESWNKSASILLGLKHPQDSGQPVTNLIRHPDFIRFLMRRDYTESLRMTSPIDDEMYISIRIVPYGNNQRLLMVRDITRLHLLEQMRQDFIANVSHELRTPLTVVAGYLETMVDDDSGSFEAFKPMLKTMESQTSRMQHIVNDLLLLSRLETDSKEQKGQTVDVPGMIEMIREDAMALSAGRHTIEVESDRNVCLRGSREQLLSAFSNLVYNAVQYTPDGGHVKIRWYLDNEGGHFEVEDDGDGIAPQHIPRLTERFYRVDVGRSRETGGTGLGLAIVKHVLNHHKAQLVIQSELGKGSVFRCDFPKERVLQREVA